VCVCAKLLSASFPLGVGIVGDSGGREGKRKKVLAASLPGLDEEDTIIGTFYH
jgi:hypothetical protein